MKQLINILITASLMAFVSCSGMNDIIEEYYDRGELNYIGKADSAICYGGLNRAKLVWKVGRDVRVEEFKITWNLGADSIIHPINRAELVNGYASVELPLEEGQYVFNLIQRGKNGDPSIPTEIIGNVYGDKYVKGLVPRMIRSCVVENGMAVVVLGINSDCFYSELSYTNNQGKVRKVRVEPNETTLTFDDFTYGGEIFVKTFFKPEENVIDLFSVEYTGKFPVFQKLQRDNWTIPFVSSQREDIFPVANILDGNINSLWHSNWTSTPVAPFPHCIIIDMNEERQINQVEVFQDPARMTFKSARVFVGLDNSDDASYTEKGTINCPQGDMSAVVEFTTPQKARFIKLVFEESYNPPYVAISEVYAYGK